jgi:hypothetical protein
MKMLYSHKNWEPLTQGHNVIFQKNGILKGCEESRLIILFHCLTDGIASVIFVPMICYCVFPSVDLSPSLSL